LATVVPVQAGAEALPFRDATFDGVVSSCALKHWSDPSVGVRECVRVARPGATVVFVEIDGCSTTDEVRRFTGSTAVPPGLREAYVRFAMRTVVGVAPSAEHLRASLAAGGLADPEVLKVDGLPFNAVVAVRR
jgi:ubiquinone/menaquinone biosynthesis C-methylase UbiE